MGSSRTEPARRFEIAVDSRDPGPTHSPAAASSHPAWRAFVRFCEELRYGEIERLKIQDGLPVLAEVVKRKTKFT
jgi:hypothetical protein